MERTCILVKPDGVCKRHVGDVLIRFEKSGFKLIGMKMLRLKRAEAEVFYEEHKGRPFYEGLVGFMTSAPILATAWEGPNVVLAARALLGATDAAKAEAGTLRRDFGTDNRRNLLHGSDSVKSAERELPFFFKPDELFSYTESDWHNA